MKKSILVLLALFVVVSSSSGCVAVLEKENELPKKYEKPQEISLAFWDIQIMQSLEEKDGMQKYIEKMFNVSITPINLNWSDYNERYLVMCVSDTLPDAFPANMISGMSNNSKLKLSDMISKKLIRALPEDLSEYPNVKATVDNFRNTITYFDNEIYTFPRTSFQNRLLSSSDAGIIVRKDWMDRLGLKQPESIDDFINIVSSFAKADPDGNGKHDTIGYNGNQLSLGKWLMLGITPKCNVYNWVDDGGIFKPAFLLPEFEAVVNAYQKLYKSGGLDPNFYVKKPTDAMYDFAHGRLGAIEYKLAPSSIAGVEAYWNEFHDETEPFSSCVSYLKIFPAEDGKRYSNSSTAFWSETLFSSHVDDEKMSRILAVFEYLLSEEAFMFTRFGIEGTDYRTENGRFTSTLDLKNKSLSSALVDKYPSLNLFQSIAAWGGTEKDFSVSEQNVLRYGKYSTEMAFEALEWNKQNTVMVERPERFISMIKEDSKMFTTSAMLEDFTKVIISEGDAVVMWREVVENWRENGLDEYVNSLNEQAARQGIFPESKK